MANTDPYAEFTADLPPAGESSGSDPYAGFTADLPPVSKPSMMQQVISANQKLRPYLPAIGIAANPMQGLIAMNVSKIPGELNDLGKVSGEATAEKVGKTFPNHPGVGVAAGELVTLAPALAQMAPALANLYGSEVPMIKGLLSTPEELGPEFQAGRTAAGISGNLPVQSGKYARFPAPEYQGLETRPPRPLVAAEPLPSVSPASYPKDPAAFLNFARTRVQTFGDRLSPQELDDYKTILSKMLNGGEVPRGTDYYAVASQLKNQVTDLHNAAIPGREQLNQVYQYAKMFPNMGDAVAGVLKKFGPWAVRAAFGGAGYEAVRKMFGG